MKRRELWDCGCKPQGRLDLCVYQKKFSGPLQPNCVSTFRYVGIHNLLAVAHPLHLFCVKENVTFGSRKLQPTNLSYLRAIR